jgi:hypothetical protein
LNKKWIAYDLLWALGAISTSIMYLVNFGLFKSPKLIIDHLKKIKLKPKKTLIWGPPKDATIDINDVLLH